MRLRFQGEMMHCALCGKTQRSDPAVESGWTYIEYADQGGYVCPDHLPSNREMATKEEYAACYEVILAAVLGLRPDE